MTDTLPGLRRGTPVTGHDHTACCHPDRLVRLTSLPGGWDWKRQVNDRGYATTGSLTYADITALCERPDIADIALRWDHRSGRFGLIPTPAAHCHTQEAS